MTPVSTGVLVQVSIYNLKMQKVARTIRPDRSRSLKNSNHVIDYGLSGGLNKLLYVVWGPVDPTLTVYKWYSGKVIASARDCGILRATFEAGADQLLAVSAHGIMKFSLIQDSLHKCVMHEMKDVCSGFHCDGCVMLIAFLASWSPKLNSYIRAGAYKFHMYSFQYGVLHCW